MKRGLVYHITKFQKTLSITYDKEVLILIRDLEKICKELGGYIVNTNYTLEFGKIDTITKLYQVGTVIVRNNIHVGTEKTIITTDISSLEGYNIEVLIEKFRLFYGERNMYQKRIVV